MGKLTIALVLLLLFSCWRGLRFLQRGKFRHLSATWIRFCRMTNSQNRLISAAVFLCGHLGRGFGAGANKCAGDTRTITSARCSRPATDHHITRNTCAIATSRLCATSSSAKCRAAILEPGGKCASRFPSDVRQTTGIEVDGLTRIDGDSLGALRQQDGGWALICGKARRTNRRWIWSPGCH